MITATTMLSMSVTSRTSPPGAPSLTTAQAAALAHVREVASGHRPAALAVIARHLAASAVTCRPEELVRAVAAHGGLTVNFHPDRLLADGRTVAGALADEGVYRSQFVTGISNGGLTAYPGGDRDRWEERLFGGAYHRAGVRPADRPVYGGLNLLGHPDGACPRFGSCHLVLRPEVLGRATLCFGDSSVGPRDLVRRTPVSRSWPPCWRRPPKTGPVWASPAWTSRA